MSFRNKIKEIIPDIEKGDLIYLEQAYLAFEEWSYEKSPKEDFLNGLTCAAFLAGAK
jgi:hypothetical protein